MGVAATLLARIVDDPACNCQKHFAAFEKVIRAALQNNRNQSGAANKAKAAHRRLLVKDFKRWHQRKKGQRPGDLSAGDAMGKIASHGQRLQIGLHFVKDCCSKQQLFQLSHCPATLCKTSKIMDSPGKSGPPGIRHRQGRFHSQRSGVDLPHPETRHVRWAKNTKPKCETKTKICPPEFQTGISYYKNRCFWFKTCKSRNNYAPGVNTMLLVVPVSFWSTATKLTVFASVTPTSWIIVLPRTLAI